MIDLKQALSVWIDAVRAAEKITLSYFGHKDIKVKQKENENKMSKHYMSPATIADIEAEQTIRQTIKWTYPEHSFSGEEKRDEGKSPYRWIIDPIDGTKAYMRGMDDRAILLALEFEGTIVMGISLMPTINELVYATQGWWCYINKQRCQVSTRELKESFISHERQKYFMRASIEKKLVNLQSNIAYSIGNKTPRMFHYLLQWKIEWVIGVPWVNFYDIAPYIVMIQEAWWKFTTYEGNVFSWEKDSFIASNAIIHQDCLKFFTEDNKKQQ